MKIKFFMTIAVLAMLILCSFAFAEAQTASTRTFDDCVASPTVSCLTYWVDQISQQLTQLQSQQGATAIKWCHTFNKNLGWADSNTAEIASLHTALQIQGFSYAPDTGNVYDMGTSQAIIKFQTKYGIAKTGYIGNQTRKKLNLLYGCK